MDKLTAQRKVKETLQSSFDKNRFIDLVKNLLNRIDESKAFQCNTQYVKEIYRDYIKSYERIATYTDPNDKVIDILIVYLQRQTTLERARTAQRNFVAKYLKDRAEKDAGLVAFVSPNPADWRFSFVKMEYKFTGGPGGKIKVKEEFTPAKRYSFLVGEYETSHTAQSQIVPVLMQVKAKPSLEDIEDIFNIEKVTKEFFGEYRRLFISVKESLDNIIKNNKKIRDNFENKGIDSVNFVKKLLGQIVFLYFLQRKGWFGVERDAEWGSGHKNFLRRLFNGNHGKYDNFFNDILEPLFYDALARDRSDIDHWYNQFKCKIPFLNGGLFDPIGNYDWVRTDIILSNELFNNTHKTKEGDIGDGILDIFDRYNFTVKEDEPLEKEVAVDPEMLGKVFENLLEVKDRKSKGTYYTPREIVHYMCQQSLINYLTTELENKSSKEDIEKYIKLCEIANENEARVANHGKETDTYRYKLPESIRKHAQLIDEKLADIKVCDPAIGSGAFPVGMMTEIVKARIVLSNYIDNTRGRTAYNFKRHCIQSSLYGVDIDPSAVDIAKLRLWLSLIVDEEDIKQIKPLPNLDYKIMQGNSLLEEYEGIKLFDEKLISALTYNNEKEIEGFKQRQSYLRKEINELQLKNKLTAEKKAMIDNEFKTIEKQLKQMSKPEIFGDQMGLSEKCSVARKKAEELKKLHEKYFEITRKTDKDDLKKRIDQLEWDLIEETLKEQNKVSELRKIEELKRLNIKPFFLWKLNFAEVFQARGGFDVLIANPPYVKEYVNRAAFDGLRNSPYYKGKMDLWYLFACMGIDLLRNDSGILTFIAQNNWVTSHGASKMRNKVINDTQILSMIDFSDFKIFEAGIQTMVMMFRKDNALSSYSFDYRRLHGDDFGIKDVISLLNKEENIKVEYLLPTITRSNYVDKMLTFSGSDVEPILEKVASKANFQFSEKEVAQGIVYPQDYINNDSKIKLGGNYNIGDGIFVLNDKEKIRLHLSKAELELIKPLYSTSKLFKWAGNPKNQEWVIYTDSRFKDKKQIENYPNIKKHLDQFKKVITSDNKPYGLHRARDEYYFKGEKIIAVRKCLKPTFTYVDYDSYVSATFYVIKTDRADHKYLTGLLNSKLIAFWLKHRGKMQGTNYQIDKEPLIALPIIKPNQANQDAIASIVYKIINIMKSENSNKKQARIREYEKQIDQMIYDLYGLTPEEIKVVEGEISVGEG